MAMKKETKDRIVLSSKEESIVVTRGPILDDDDDSLEEKCENLNFPQTRVDSMDDDDDDDDDEMEERFRDFSLDREERTLEYVREASSMPSWLRPTLFGYLNFSDEGPGPDILKVSSSSKIDGSDTSSVGEGSGSNLALISILKSDHIKPDLEDFARVSLVSQFYFQAFVSCCLVLHHPCLLREADGVKIYIFFKTTVSIASIFQFSLTLILISFNAFIMFRNYSILFRLILNSAGDC